MIIGIDIGSCFSKACVKDDLNRYNPVTVTLEGYRGKSYLMPSVASVRYNDLLVGYAAIDNRLKAPAFFINNFRDDIGGGAPYHFDHIQILPEDIYKKHLQALKQAAEQQYGKMVERAAIAYPAWFSAEQLKQIKQAAVSAGLLDAIFISEPVAIAKNNRLAADGNVLIIDIGAGISFSIIRYANNEVTIIGEPKRLPQCGGNEIDRILFKDISDKIGAGKVEELGAQNPNLPLLINSHIEILARQTKERLAIAQEAEGDINVGMDIITYHLDRQTFNGLISTMVEEAMQALTILLAETNLKPADLGNVILCGGGANIPFIRERVEVLLERRIDTSYNRELICAAGAIDSLDSKESFDPASKTNNAGNGSVKAGSCPNCGSALNARFNYCTNCGHVLYFPGFVLDDMKDGYRATVKNVMADIITGSVYNGPALASATVARMVKTIRTAQHLTGKEPFSAQIAPGLVTEMQDFLERCVSGEFHIALIGSIKAGKSTMLNALLQKDLASVNAAPETATLTKFRASEGQNRVRVSFYTKEEWASFWQSIDSKNNNPFFESYKDAGAEKFVSQWVGHHDITMDFPDDKSFRDEIAKWSSAASVGSFFVKELEISIKEFNVPKEIVFVDTPGLNDPVAFRSDITKKYMKRANIVVVCVTAEKLIGPDLETIFNAFANTRYNPGKIYVLATKIDKLNERVNDWKTIRAVWIKLLAGPECYNSRELAERQLIPVSAYEEILLQKFNPALMEDRSERFKYRKNFEDILFQITGNEDIIQLDSADIRQKVSEFNNMRKARQILMQDEVQRSKNLLLQDISEKYKLLKAQLIRDYGLVNKSQHQLLNDLNAGIETVMERQRGLRSSMEKNEQDQAELAKKLAIFREGLTEKVNRLIKSIKDLKK